jgi:uncharacterized protein YxeA
MNRQIPRSKAYLASRRGTYIARGSVDASNTLQSQPHTAARQDKLGGTPKAHKRRSSTKDLPFKKRQSRSKVLSRKSIPKKRIKRSLTLRRTASYALVSLFAVSNLMLGGYFVADKYYDFDLSGSRKVSSVADSSLVLGESSTPRIEATNFPVAVSEDQTNTFSAVQIRGVDTQSNLLYPDDDSYIAWYERSAKPGLTKNSASLFFAKVNNQNKSDNSFATASKNLDKGAYVKLTLGGGNVLTFEVVKKDTIDHQKTNIKSLLQSESASKPGLNILVSTDDGNKVVDTVVYCVQVKTNVNR